ncbi:MAG: HAMP domain-containing protein [Flavobacteriales bacterium]|nr:HAMP domain-containing protein [Flavobacteriales bacterium]
MRRASLLFLLALAFLGVGLASLTIPDADPAEPWVPVLQDHILAAQATLDKTARTWAQRASIDSLQGLWAHLRSAPASDDDQDVRIWRDKSIIFWAGRLPLPDSLLTDRTDRIIERSDGLYLHARAQQGPFIVHALHRIWHAPPIQNRYLQNAFSRQLGMPQGLEAATGAGMGPVVRDASGQVLFRLVTGETPVTPHAPWALLLMLAGAALLLSSFWHAASALSSGNGAAALFTALVLALRWATLRFGPLPGFKDLELFDPTHYASSFANPSLGDLAINGVLVLLLAVFIRRHVNLTVRTAFLALPLLILFSSVLNSVVMGLVQDSRFSLNLFQVQRLSWESAVALACIALLQGAWLLLAHVVVKTLPGRWSPAQAVFAATLPAIWVVWHHAHAHYDLVPILWPAPALLLLSGTVHWQQRQAAALGLLVLLAATTAHLLDRHTLKRLDGDREALAEQLAVQEDPVVELLFAQAAADVLNDAAVQQWFIQDSLPVSANDLDQRVRQSYFTGYWERYETRLYLFSRNGQLRATTSPDASATWAQVVERIEQGVPTLPAPQLRNVHRPGERALYMAALSPPDDTLSGVLFVELRSRLVHQGLGFPELLLPGTTPGHEGKARPADALEPYVWARYQRGRLADHSGPVPFPLSWTPTLPDDVLRGYDLLAFGDPATTQVVIGFARPGVLAHLTAFSYLFMLYSVAFGLVMLMRRMATGMRLKGLNMQLRLALFGYAAIGLVLFAAGTRNLVDRASDKHQDDLLEERMQSVMMELRQKLRGEANLQPELGPYLDHLLGSLSNVFFTDIMLYGPDGGIIASSREQIFRTGSLGPRIHPLAHAHIMVQGRMRFTQDEHIGSATFRNTYAPLRNDRGEVLGVLSLPYFARQEEVDQERASSTAAIANLFVLLFMLSSVAAALIASWTTRPLQLLRRGLERIQLGARNEPLNYSGADELAELVAVYNRKVEELRASAERLALSERESAWREMARQVAHEIKNPLTPMKLGIQQFQRTWDPTAPDARERLERFSRSLVEQIDALNGVATAFSQFAQMPPARPEPLDLREVLHAAVEVFRATPGCSIVLHETPSLPLHADREHLLRVFNNLLKNAVQAIPEGRAGHIEVRAWRQADQAIVEVRDNGAGIPADVHERIFTPSFTTKSSGMGLGLALVKRMVEGASGKVRFESVVGDGTSFFVELPLRS